LPKAEHPKFEGHVTLNDDEYRKSYNLGPVFQSTMVD